MIITIGIGTRKKNGECSACFRYSSGVTRTIEWTVYMSWSKWREATPFDFKCFNTVTRVARNFGSFSQSVLRKSQSFLGVWPEKCFARAEESSKQHQATITTRLRIYGRMYFWNSHRWIVNGVICNPVVLFFVAGRVRNWGFMLRCFSEKYIPSRALRSRDNRIHSLGL